MRAKLLTDQVSVGSGLERWEETLAIPKTPQGREFAQKLVEVARHLQFSPRERAVLRRNSVPAQDNVEVLEIFDQVQNAHLFNTPTPPGLVARIRAVNFDGEEVEVLVPVEDLLFEDGNRFIPFDEFARARGIIDAAMLWQQLQEGGNK